MNGIVNTTTRQRNGADKKSDKFKNFKVSVLLFLTNNTKKLFTVRKVQNSMTIKSLRSTIELISGIPYYLQRLHYIDDG